MNSYKCLLLCHCVADGVIEEQGMLTPVDDVLYVDTESNDQGHCGSGSASVVLNTDVDMLPTVVSHEHTSVVIFNEETDGMQEDEIKVTSEIESAQVAIQSDNETCTASVPLVDSKLSTCSSREPVKNIAQQKCLSVSGVVLGSTDENCIAEVAEVEIQHNKSDTIVIDEETDSACIMQGVTRNEDCECKEAGGMQEDEIKVTSERQSVQVVKEHNYGETCAPAKPLVESELATCSDTEPKTNSAQQECLPVDKLPTAGSCEHSDDRIVIFNEETGDKQEYEVRVFSETDSDSDCVILDDCEETGGMQKDEINLSSEMKSVQVVRQHASSETCATAIPSVDSGLSASHDTVPKTNSPQPECLFVSGAVLRPANKNGVAEVAEVEIQTNEIVVDLSDDDDLPMTNSVQQECSSVPGVVIGSDSERCVTRVAEATHEATQPECLFVTGAVVRPANKNCVVEVAEVEIQPNKSDIISTLEERDSDCVIQDVSRSEELDCRQSRNVNEMVVDVSDDDDPPVSISVQQEYSLVSGAVVGSENQSCVTRVAEPTQEETDSDCVIQGVSRNDECLFWPTGNEGEMTVHLLNDDHAYCRSAESVQSSRAMMSSSGICISYTSQSGINSNSVPSMQTNVFNVATVLPFPSLIAEPYSRELCSHSQFSSGENAVDNTCLFRVAGNELMDTQVSMASGVGSENSCVMMADPSYPVVEIVPSSNRDVEVSVFEQSGVSLQEPCSTAAADISVLSNVASVDSDSAAFGITAAPNTSSRRGKASVLTLV